MRNSINRAIDGWLKAGVIDATTAQRLRTHQAATAPTATSRLAVFAFGFGGLLLGAGALLFVAAHWQELGPGARFGGVVALLVLLHLAAGVATPRHPSLTTSLHAAGTAVLGAGIFLSGQIFHLAAHWPTAFLLWAMGAALALAMLRDWPHTLWVATLVPLWLWAEWMHRAEVVQPPYTEVVALGVGFTALGAAYLSATSHALRSAWRRALSALGAVVLFPAAWGLVGVGLWRAEAEATQGSWAAPALVWTLAITIPLALAVALRRREAWPVAVAAALAYTVTRLDTSQTPHELLSYVTYAIASIGLILWGLRDREPLRVNLGVAGFALTLLWFYFGNLFDMLGRAFGLIGLGVVFIGGGWWLERARRSLVKRIGGTPG